MAKKKRKKWYEKHHEECEGFRRAFGAKAGDGLKLLEQMKRGNDAQRAFAKVLQQAARDSFMSADYFDAIISCYASNKTLAMLMGMLDKDEPKPH